MHCDPKILIVFTQMDITDDATSGFDVAYDWPADPQWHVFNRCIEPCNTEQQIQALGRRRLQFQFDPWNGYWNGVVQRHCPPVLADRLRQRRDIAVRLHRQDKAFFYRDLIIEEVV